MNVRDARRATLAGLVAVLALIGNAALAQSGVSSVRCGDQVVHVGDTPAVVAEACGQAVFTIHYTHATPARSGWNVVEVDVWEYGPTGGDMGRRFRFENHVLVTIQLER